MFITFDSSRQVSFTIGIEMSNRDRLDEAKLPLSIKPLAKAAANEKGGFGPGQRGLDSTNSCHQYANLTPNLRNCSVLIYYISIIAKVICLH